MMKNKILIACILLMLTGMVNAQNEKQNLYLPVLAAKTNALYLATLTPNLGLEIGLSKKLTLDLSASYNPIKFSDDKYWKHWLVQPELRFWTCERFNGHFFGLHGHYAQFNFEGIDMLGLDKHHYQGDLYGAGVSYGYNWILNNRWAIEATVGVGYARIDYDKALCDACKSSEKNYWGPTKAGISLIYILK